MRLESFFTVPEQLTLFAECIFLGIPVGVFFDMFRAARIILPHSAAATALEDVLFFSAYAVFIMMFTYACGRGEFRMYYVAGNAAGFSVYYFTFGKITASFFTVLAAKIKTSAKLIRKFLNKKRHIQ